MKLKLNIVETDNGQFFNKSYIVENLENRTAVIVDPAWNPAEYEKIIQDHRLEPKTILLTHSHIDHVNLVDYFSSNYHSEVYISETEAACYGFSCGNLHLIHDRDLIDADGINVKCFLMPGHTRGSMIYEIGYNLFVGDTIFYEGCGICNHSRDSLEDMFESIQKIKRIFADTCKVYPGHVYFKEVGQPLGELKRDNFSFFLEKKEFIAYQMKKSL